MTDNTLHLQSLQGLSQRCQAWKVVAHAKAMAAEEKMADDVQRLKLDENGSHEGKLACKQSK